MSDAPLSGRRILLIGGGTQGYGESDPPPGIGRAIATVCASHGAALAVFDRDRDAAETTVAAARRAGGAAIAVVADVSEDSEVERATNEARGRLGGLNGVVVNVGVAAGVGLAGTSADVWDLVFSVNARGHFLAAKHGLRLLDDGGSLVFISSTAALLPGTSDIPAYAASKAALDGLSRFVAREGAARAIRANVVMAGLIDTPLGRLASKVSSDRDEIAIPLGRQGRSDEVAEAVAFLLSDRASYITAQRLIVDGGLSGAR